MSVGDEFDPLAEVAPEQEPNGPLSQEQLAALGGSQGEAHPAPAPEADPDEEPPEPEGHRLSQAVADYLGTKEFFHGPLPHDIAAIWGHPPIRVSDEATARILIGAWGMDEFRGSTLHKAALQDAARKANSHAARTRFKSEREKRKK